jgi:hypothetical protein
MRPGCALLALIVIALAACSDNSGGGKDMTIAKDTKAADSTGSNDTGKAVDKANADGVKLDGGKRDGRTNFDGPGIRLDTGVKFDGASGLNCGQVAACANQCSKLRKRRRLPHGLPWRVRCQGVRGSPATLECPQRLHLRQLPGDLHDSRHRL